MYVFGQQIRARKNISILSDTYVSTYVVKYCDTLSIYIKTNRQDTVSSWFEHKIMPHLDSKHIESADMMMMMMRVYLWIAPYDP